MESIEDVHKCKVMHISTNNLQASYVLGRETFLEIACRGGSGSWMT